MDKNKMLIDATHPEETRVVVVRNGRVEEFDFESAARKLLRGNIYLAKVTRVEPSLQAAFVEYGGNRHGFLAFNEIHPDYYQIPVADREMLKQEEAEAEAQAEADADERSRRRNGRRRSSSRYDAAASDAPPAHDERHGDDYLREDSHPAEPLSHDDGHADVRHADDLRAPARDADIPHGEHDLRPSHDDEQPDHGNVEEIGSGDEAGPSDNGHGEADMIEQVASEEDVLEEVPERPRRRMRQYKIQEVIKRRQILLIQVVKEERGNKGAALTTYISLAGRYTVLMPNTGRGGGISRKITQPQDRKRLKAIAEELDVAEGMGLIIRTAGAARTKQEIKRDYEYLLRLWESVRDLTLTSTAPCLVYEEGNLVKRSIRDLYSKDIDDIFVAGDGAYREARDFMGMLMPGHGDHVIRYDAPEPLFNRSGVERQLNALFNPVVTLRSGGYIVINQTEALVAVDVNSGKSTREFSIEETALNTNMEAAEEIARQLKLRDLAGLIVIDFIDMEEKRNNRSVERRLKDSLRHDRARIQVGRISHFGLLEMSRQRLRTGMLEGSTSQCPHCQGTGHVRSTESVALAVLRGLEESLMKQPSSLAATTSASVALYILNHKRPYITAMEHRFGIAITVEASDRMHGASFTVERTAAAPERVKPASRTAVSMDWGFDGGEADVEAPEVPVREARDDRDGEEVRDGRREGRGRDRARDRDREPRGRHQRDHDRHERDRFRDRGEPRAEGGVEEIREPDDHDRDDDQAGDREPVRGRHDGERDRDGGEEAGRSRRRRRRRGRRDGGEQRFGGDDHGRPRAAGAIDDMPPAHDDATGDVMAAAAPGPARFYDAEAGGVGRGGGEPRHASRDAGMRDNDADSTMVPDREVADGGASEHDAGESGDAERRPRGRRRGRRGGRARGRADGGAPLPVDAPQPYTTDNGDWGVVDDVDRRAPEPREPVPFDAAAGGHASSAERDAARATGWDEPGEPASQSQAVRPAVVEIVAPPERPSAPVTFEPIRLVEAASQPEHGPAPQAQAYVAPPVPAQPIVTAAPSTPEAPPAAETAVPRVPEEPAQSVKKGWWQRRFGGE